MLDVAELIWEPIADSQPAVAGHRTFSPRRGADRRVARSVGGWSGACEPSPSDELDAVRRKG